MRITLAAWCCLAWLSAVQPSKLSGVIRDESGRPIAGALVAARGTDGSSFETKSASDGSFSIAVSAQSDVAVTIVAPGFSTRALRLDAGSRARPLEIVLFIARHSEHLTVAASRIEQRINDVAANVSVVDEAALRRAPAVMRDDVLRQIPSFSLFRRSSSVAAHPTAQGVSLRGVGPSGVSRTLVMLDGIPFNDPFGGWVYWSRVPASVDRVEVAEGSSANLFGSAALGGAISIVTTTPERPFLDLGTEIGNRESGSIRASAGARYGHWTVLADSTLFRTSGYPVVRAQERGPVDTRVALEFANAYGVLEYNPADRIRAFARAGYLNETRDNGKRATLDGAAEENSTNWTTGAAGLRVRPTSSSELRASAFIDRVRFRSNFLAVPAATPPRSIGRMTLNQFVPSSGGGALVQWTVTGGSAHALAVGGDWRLVEGESREDLLDRDTGTRTVLLRRSGGRQNLGGVFLQEVFTPVSRATLTAAIRHDRWRNTQGHNRELNPDGTPADGDRPGLAARSDFATSPRLSAVFRLSNAASLWGSAGWAFRAPTLNELYRQFRVGAVTTLANESLGAETLRSVETGLRFSLSRSTLLRATAFDNVLEDAISNVTVSSGESAIIQQRQNLGRSRVRGIQTDAEFRTARSFSIRAGYLFSDALVEDFAAAPLLTGKQIPQVPRHRATAEVSYWGPRFLQFTLTVQAAGRQFDDDLNTRTVPGESRPGLPPYAILGLRASKTLKRKLEVFVSAQNLFDRTYVVGTLPTTIGAPRLVIGGVRWRAAR